MFSWIHWDPSRDLFTIPGIDRPVGWYGILFALGFFLGYFILVHLLTRMLREERKITDTEARAVSYSMTDALCWFVVLGTIVGARLGHVFIYQWDFYRDHPLDIVKIWEGGLASHGGVIGILIALLFYMRVARRYLPKLGYLQLVDLLTIPAALTGFCIRIGNFMNQEIVGTPTEKAWGVIFGHPVDGPHGIPLHPVQLYEAALYLGIFVFLYAVWNRYSSCLRPGMLTGLLFVSVFGGRFALEFFKGQQGPELDAGLQLGQLLSLPFVWIGIALIWRALPKTSTCAPNQK